MDEALERAIKAAGGQSALAEKFNQRGKRITKSAISQWKTTPHKRVLDVEEITGVSRHELRPDIYPAEQAA